MGGTNNPKRGKVVRGRETMTDKQFKTRMAILLIFGGLAVVSSFYFPAKSLTVKYAAGKNYLAEGKYQLATEAFDGLGQFRDSKELAKQAMLKFEQMEAESRVESYRQALYAQAVEFFESASYEEALSILAELAEFPSITGQAPNNFSPALPDSTRLTVEHFQVEVKYQLAQQRLDMGDYESAISLLYSLGSYAESDELLSSALFDFFKGQ